MVIYLCHQRMKRLACIRQEKSLFRPRSDHHRIVATPIIRASVVPVTTGTGSFHQKQYTHRTEPPCKLSKAVSTYPLPEENMTVMIHRRRGSEISVEMALPVSDCCCRFFLTSPSFPLNNTSARCLYLARRSR